MHPDLVKYLLRQRPPRIVYVSCNPATCARDLDYLAHGLVRLFLFMYGKFPEFSFSRVRLTCYCFILLIFCGYVPQNGKKLQNTWNFPYSPKCCGQPWKRKKGMKIIAHIISWDGVLQRAFGEIWKPRGLWEGEERLRCFTVKKFNPLYCYTKFKT